MAISSLQIPTQVILETVASWLVRSSPDRAVRVHALAGNIVLCFRARHFTLKMPLYPGVQKSTGEFEFNAGGNPAMH